jgi:hypothetical protein
MNRSSQGLMSQELIQPGTDVTRTDSAMDCCHKNRFSQGLMSQEQIQPCSDVTRTDPTMDLMSEEQNIQPGNDIITDPARY